NVLTNVFSYLEGRNAKNVIIQSGLNVLGETKTYLRETMCDEADVAVPAGLKSGSKCGMSAWAAMYMSTQGFSPENILKRFYHWAPVLMNKIEITQNGSTKYLLQWGKCRLSKDGNNGVEREIVINKAKDVSFKESATLRLYFTDKLKTIKALWSDVETGTEIITLKPEKSKENSQQIGIKNIRQMDGYSYVTEAEISSTLLRTLLGDKSGTGTIPVVIAVDVMDRYNFKKNDQLPMSAAIRQTTDSTYTGYEDSVLGSDETNVFSLVNKLTPCLDS
ncbi:MAG TPA: hypothetical protein PKJ42_08125, partial [Candidatus Goldiibacteriota bacterium]|nr:hypothetical protein [Candidatus Goldiibacteriota bacterium]